MMKNSSYTEHYILKEQLYGVNYMIILKLTFISGKSHADRVSLNKKKTIHVICMHPYSH